MTGRVALWWRIGASGVLSQRATALVSVVALTIITTAFAVVSSLASSSVDESALALLALVATAITILTLDVGNRRRTATTRVLGVNGARAGDRAGQAMAATVVLCAPAVAIGLALRTVWGLGQADRYVRGGAMPDPSSIAWFGLVGIGIPAVVAAWRAWRGVRSDRRDRRTAAQREFTPLGWCVGALLALALVTPYALLVGRYEEAVIAGGVLLLGGAMTLGAASPAVARPLLRGSGVVGLTLRSAAEAPPSRVRASAAIVAALGTCAAGAITTAQVLDAAVAGAAPDRAIVAAPTGVVAVRSTTIDPSDLDESTAAVRAALPEATWTPVQQVVAAPEGGETSKPRPLLASTDPVLPSELSAPALLTPEVADLVGIDPTAVAGERAVVTDPLLLDPSDGRLRLPGADVVVDALVDGHGLSLGAPNVYLPASLVAAYGLDVQAAGYLGRTASDGVAVRAALGTLLVPDDVVAARLGVTAGRATVMHQGGRVDVYTDDRVVSTADFFRAGLEQRRHMAAQMRSFVPPLLVLGAVVLAVTVVLNAAERRRDDELLVVQGASGTVHRRLAAAEAAYVGGVAGAAGALLGSAWALVAAVGVNGWGRWRDLEPLAAVPLVVPWPVLGVVVAVPVLAALVVTVLVPGIRRVDLASLTEPW